MYILYSFYHIYVYMDGMIGEIMIGRSVRSSVLIIKISYLPIQPPSMIG